MHICAYLCRNMGGISGRESESPLYSSIYHGERTEKLDREIVDDPREVLRIRSTGMNIYINVYLYIHMEGM